MIYVGFILEYDWPEGIEHDRVAFPLWDGDDCRTPLEAHSMIDGLLRRCERFELIDAAGEVWEFHRDTVWAVVVWDGATVARLEDAP